MIGLPGSIFQACQDVIELDGRIISRDFAVVSADTKKFQNIDDSHPSSTQACPATAGKLVRRCAKPSRRR